MHGGSNLNKKMSHKIQIEDPIWSYTSSEEISFFYNKSQKLSFIALDSKRDAKVITTQSKDSIIF
jgi:hypothetical protein